MQRSAAVIVVVWPLFLRPEEIYMVLKSGQVYTGAAAAFVELWYGNATGLATCFELIDLSQNILGDDLQVVKYISILDYTSFV